MLKEAYLDWISAAPVLPEVLLKMSEAAKSHYGNPSSRLHPWGVNAQRAMDRARAQVAALIGALDPVELIFCSSATEANNLALKGIALASDRGKHIVIGAIDHPSVRMTAQALLWQGFAIDYVPVDEFGIIKLDRLSELIRDDTALVSIQHANSEIGTIQPLEQIAKICNSRGVPLHSDGSGVVGILPIDIENLGVTAYSFGANAFWGPVGAAALWLRKGTDLLPQMNGGVQERKQRAGTENIPAIVGMGNAAEIARHEIMERAIKLRKLSNQLLDGLTAGFGNCAPACFYQTGHPISRLPQIASFRLEWVEGEALLLGIGADRIAAVSGSACASPELGASYVLEACGVPEEQRSGSITLSVGWSTTQDEIEYAIDRIVYHGKRLYAMSPMAKLVN